MTFGAQMASLNLFLETELLGMAASIGAAINVAVYLSED
jgi:hypothetical protein